MFNPANEVSSINFSAIIGGALNAVVDAQKESAETTVNFVRKVGFKPGKINEKGHEIGVGDPITVSFSYDKEVSPAHTAESKEFRIEVMNGGSGYNDADSITLTINNKELDANVTVEDGRITGAVLNSKPENDDIANNTEINVTDKKNEGKEAKLVLKVAGEGKLVPALYQKMRIDVPILTMMPIPFIKIDNTDIEFNVKINSVSTTESKDTTNSTVKSDSNVSYKGWWGLKAGTTLNTSVSNQKSTSSNETVKKDYSLNVKVHAVQDDMPAGMSRILDILEGTIATKAVSAPAPKAAVTEKSAEDGSGQG